MHDLLSIKVVSISFVYDLVMSYINLSLQRAIRDAQLQQFNKEDANDILHVSSVSNTSNLKFAKYIVILIAYLPPFHSIDTFHGIAFVVPFNVVIHLGI